MFVRTELEGYLIHPKKPYKMEVLDVNINKRIITFHLIRSFNSAGKRIYQKDYSLYGAGVNGHLGKKWIDKDAKIQLSYAKNFENILIRAYEKNEIINFILDENYWIEKIWNECLF